MNRIATYSIVAHDARSGVWAVGVQSKFLAVGSVVPHAQSQVGAIATQAWANPTFGPNGLRLLQSGLSAEETLRTLIESDPGREHRQLGIVDRSGQSAAWTGEACMAWAGHETGPSFTCQGNIRAGPAVVADMARTFRDSDPHRPLGERILDCLTAAEAAGGDRRGRQSAALLVVKAGAGYNGLSDRYIDLRVDDDPEPLDKLSRLLRLHHLHFDKPAPEQLKPLAQCDPDRILEGLQRLGYLPSSSRHFDTAAWEALKAWAHRENFEQRWVGSDRLDEEMMAYFFEQATPRPGDAP